MAYQNLSADDRKLYDDYNQKIYAGVDVDINLDKRDRLLGTIPTYSQSYLEDVNSSTYGTETKSYFQQIVDAVLPKNNVSYRSEEESKLWRIYQDQLDHLTPAQGEWYIVSDRQARLNKEYKSNLSNFQIQEINAGKYGAEARGYFRTQAMERLGNEDISFTHPTWITDPDSIPRDANGNPYDPAARQQRAIAAKESAERNTNLMYLAAGGIVLFALLKN